MGKSTLIGKMNSNSAEGVCWRGAGLAGNHLRSARGSQGQAATYPKLLIHYLEGQRDLVSRLMMEIIGVIIWLLGVINLLTKSR